MAQKVVFATHPIDPLGGWIGFQRRRIAGIIEWIVVMLFLIRFMQRRSFGRSNGFAGIFFLRFERFFQPGPAHFFGDDALTLGVLAIFVEQFGIFIRARVAFTHEFFVIELV